MLIETLLFDIVVLPMDVVPIRLILVLILLLLHLRLMVQLHRKLVSVRIANCHCLHRVHPGRRISCHAVMLLFLLMLLLTNNMVISPCLFKTLPMWRLIILLLYRWLPLILISDRLMPLLRLLMLLHTIIPTDVLSPTI